MIEITEDEIRSSLGIVPSSPFDSDWIEQVTAAANAFIRRNRPDLATAAATDPDVQDVRLGLRMLAVRWYQRRGSEQSASFADFGPLPAVDKDIEILLGVGRGAAPVIA